MVCGHGAVMGDFRADFLASIEVLEKFGEDLKKARRNYEAFISDRVGKFKKRAVLGRRTEEKPRAGWEFEWLGRRGKGII